MTKNKYEERSFRSYQKIADHYDDTFDGRYTLDFKNQLLGIVRIPEGGQVLDVACGNGRLLNMLARKHRFSGYGVDLSDKMVENAARLNPGMVLKQASCDALPYDDERFDVLTVCAAFHHFPDAGAFAKEAFRVLKSNGKLYIAEVYYASLLRLLFHPLIRLSPSGDVKLYSPQEIIQILVGAGFRRGDEHFHGHIQIIRVDK